LTLFRVVDIETTGTEPPAEIIEFGRVDLDTARAPLAIDRPLARLYRPLRGIPPETMAVHHITEGDIPEDAPVCTPDKLRQAVFGGSSPDVLVAHNSAFEQKFIGPEATDALPWICTYKSALRVWPEAPGHSNQVLRYWLGLKLEEKNAMPPHRAGPDAFVTAHILAELLKAASVEDMIAWTKEPRLMRSIPFGKHRGMAWSAAPLDYLQWMARQSDMDPDAIWNARQELARRGGG
jgi:exodeoxyribonuclease X